MIFRFGVFELDEEAGELRRGGRPVAVQPKPFALLGLLVRERERVVPTDEIFAALWPDTAVTPGSLTRAVSHARRAIDDTHRGSAIRSFARRGYRFCADVVALDATGAPIAAETPVDAGVRTAASGNPFVGRSDALAVLRDAWDRAPVGGAGAVVVSGPAGIGKTRLTEVFAAELERQGTLLLVGRSREDDGVPAYWLWAQILRQLHADGSLRDELGELAASAGEIADLVPELRATPPKAGSGLSPQQSRFLFFDNVARVLDRCSRQRPMLLVLEDIQWAQQSSLLMLEHLALELSGPVLLVATVREEPRELSHPVNRTLSTLRRHGCPTISLQRLSRAEVAALLQEVLGTAPPPDLTSELVARTEGVPLFVHEAIRLLAGHGDLEHLEQISKRGIALPSHALDLIHRSLEGLSRACRDVVGAGAVIGREFSLPLVASVARVKRVEALDLLDEAVAAGVVEPVAGVAASYRFTHALFQEALYDTLSAGERARLHARAAERLEKQHATDPSRGFAELAHHHHHGIAVGDPERAFQCAVLAAEQARRSFAWEQVAVHYEQANAALDHCESADPEQRLGTLLSLGEALRVAGERSRRRTVLIEAMAVARSLEMPYAFARAAIGFCDLTEWATRDPEAEEVLRDALGMVGSVSCAERARLTARIAYLAVHRDGGRPVSERAVEWAREVGEPDALQEALYSRHYALAGPEHMEERYALTQEMMASATQSVGRDATLIAIVDVASDCIARGLRSEAQQIRAKAMETAGKAPPPRMAWHMKVYDTGLALMEGRFDEVEARANDALLVGQRIDHPFAIGVHIVHMAALHRDRGEDEDAVKVLKPLSERRGASVLWVRAAVARSQRAAGRSDDAIALYQRLKPIPLDQYGRRIEWLQTHAELAHLCADLGDADGALALLDLLAPYEHLHALLPVTLNYAGPVAYAMARLLELLTRGDEAVELYEAALRSANAVHAPPIAARMQLDFGELMARRRDKARAHELLEASAALAEAHGMAAVLAAARSRLERI